MVVCNFFSNQKIYCNLWGDEVLELLDVKCQALPDSFLSLSYDILLPLLRRFLELPSPLAAPWRASTHTI